MKHSMAFIEVMEFDKFLSWKLIRTLWEQATESQAVNLFSEM